MYKIIKAEKLNEIVYLMVVEAPMVAKHCQPGQFIIVKEDDAGERIPLTICDYDREAGTVTIVFQPIGASTEKFAKLQAGDSFEDFVGPLGCPSEFVNEDPEELKKEKILFVAGGVGTAPVYPQVKWLHEHGIDADVIVGAKTKDLIILEKEMDKLNAQLASAEEKLGDSELYDASRKAELTECLQQQASAKSGLEECEMAWLEAQEQLERMLQEG